MPQHTSDIQVLASVPRPMARFFFNAPHSYIAYYFIIVDPSGPVVIILASGFEVRGFDPGRGRWIFQSVKILSMTFFGKEVKPWVSCRIFTSRKRTSSRN